MKLTRNLTKEYHAYTQSKHTASAKFSIKQFHKNFSTTHQSKKSPSEVYGELHPNLMNTFPQITDVIKHKVTRAPARGIAGTLVDPKTLTYNGKPYEEVFNTVHKAVLATMDNPIRIQPDEYGTFTSWDIFRRLAKNSFLIKEFVDTSVLRGRPFDVETTIAALRHTHLYSFTSEYERELDAFNKRNRGHQAYDLRQILKIQQQKEEKGTHTRVEDECSIVDPHDVLFTRWMNEFPNSATEKDIARELFDLPSFTPGRTEDEVMRYVIGVWAGALATGLRVALPCNSTDKTFMGWGEGALWPTSRLAVADVNKERFWMPPNKDGNYTRRTIIDSYALSVLYTVNELWKQQEGHLHRNLDAYFHSLPETRVSIAEFLRRTYTKSLELRPEKSIESAVKVTIEEPSSKSWTERTQSTPEPSVQRS